MTDTTQTPAAVEETALVVASGAGVPAVKKTVDLARIQQDAAKNTESLGLGDLSIPFIYLLQSGSPYVKEGDPKQIPGAKASSFYNTATGEMWTREEGFVFIPCAYERKVSEWLDRDAGKKGFVADHEKEFLLPANRKKLGMKQDDKKRWHMPNGNVLEETAFHYGLGLSKSGRYFPCILPLKSSGLAASRTINDLVKDSVLTLTDSGGVANVPANIRWYYPMVLFSYLETVGTNSWWKYEVKKWGPSSAKPDAKGDPTTTDADVYNAAAEFAKQYADGLLVIRRDDEDDGAPAPATGNSGGGAAAPDDDEIPF